MFLDRRMLQPLRARKTWFMVTHLIILTIACFILTLNHLWGNSGSCTLHGILAFLLLPSLLYHYASRAVQLYFIIEWNKAKIDKQGTERYKWFFEHHKLFLSSRSYVMGLSLLLTIGTTLMILIFSIDPIFWRDNPGDLMWKTMRCEWWEFPESVVNPSASNPLCACSTLSPCSYNTTQCFQAVNSTCVSVSSLNNNPLHSSGESYKVPTPDWSAICSSCSNEIDLSTSQSCMDAMGDLNTDPSIPSCPWYTATPDYSSCRTCIAASEMGKMIYFFYSITLCILSFGCSLMIVTIKDALSVRTEILFAVFALIPTILIVSLSTWDNDVYQTFRDTWTDMTSATLLFEELFMMITFWSCLFASFILPIIRSFMLEQDSSKGINSSSDVEGKVVAGYGMITQKVLKVCGCGLGGYCIQLYYCVCKSSVANPYGFLIILTHTLNDRSFS